MSNYVGSRTERGTVGPVAFGSDPGDRFLIALLAERGPANKPVLVNSMDRFKKFFGGPTPNPRGLNKTQYSTGYELLRIFLKKGGKQAYVLRIVGSNAVKADITIEDRGSTPEDTLKIIARGPGAWANDYDVVVEDGTQTDTFRLKVRDPSDTVVETWDNLEMVGSDLKKVNDASHYIRLEDLDSSNS
ncbi:MAG: hypothetical protein ABEN55_15505, partial [Bradymonadaceae bacterium]